MKLCIDGLSASNLKGSSLTSYSKELITLCNSYEYIQSNVIWDNFPLDFYWDRLENTKFIPLKLDRRSNDYSNLSKFLYDNKIDVYHSPNNGFSVPDTKVCKIVTTIHNIYPVIHKNTTDSKYYNKFMKMVPLALQNSDKIIAISDIVKSDLISNLKVPSEKIKVIYPKCSEIFVPKEDSFSINFVKRHYNITCPYLLYVGSITDRKKLLSLIPLLKKVKDKIKDIKLVIIGDITGKRQGYYNELKRQININNLDDNVVFLGIIKQTHLPLFYRACACVLDFSEYNTYPLSSVEAINCGAIVLVNKTEINTKILNKCAVYCDLSNDSMISDFICGVINNESYKEKITSLIEKPLSSTDEELLSTYEF